MSNVLQEVTASVFGLVNKGLFVFAMAMNFVISILFFSVIYRAHINKRTLRALVLNSCFGFIELYFFFLEIIVMVFLMKEGRRVAIYTAYFFSTVRAIAVVGFLLMLVFLDITLGDEIIVNWLQNHKALPSLFATIFTILYGVELFVLRNFLRAYEDSQKARRAPLHRKELAAPGIVAIKTTVTRTSSSVETRECRPPTSHIAAVSSENSNSISASLTNLHGGGARIDNKISMTQF